MKKYIFLLLVTAVGLSSCKSLNYMKEEDLKEIKMPFEEEDYPDTEIEFHSIQSAEGQNLNLMRNRALMSAKTDLSGRIKTIIGSIANQELQFANANESESFDQKATSISQQSIEKIIKVDSKTLRQKDGDGYEFWVVYKVSIEEVISLLNSSNLGFIVNSDQLFKEATTIATQN